MKKLVLLGGIRYLLPLLAAARRIGIYTITVDNIPNNVAHQFSDEYWNLSIIEKDLILRRCIDASIDGITSFGVDPGVLTAAYVAEKMGLSGVPFKSAQILQNKSLFRRFLHENNFNVPRVTTVGPDCEIKNVIGEIEYPVIVKPVDSAGSKGVSLVNNIDELTLAVVGARLLSRANSVIVEEFIEVKEFQSDSDFFSIDNKLVFSSYSNQYFDKFSVNPYVPCGFTWPSSLSSAQKVYFESEIQRLISLLKLGTSLYNVELRVGQDGKAYIMEVSPRGGGNRLSEMIKLHCGVDLIEAHIKTAVGIGNTESFSPSFNNNIAMLILNSQNTGIFNRVRIAENIKAKHLLELDLWIQKGEPVDCFAGANNSFGTLVLKFSDYHEMQKVMNDRHEWLIIEVS
jgi:biotin carboxylase